MSGNRKYLSFSQHPPPVPSIFLFLRFSDLYHFDISAKSEKFYAYISICVNFSVYVFSRDGVSWGMERSKKRAFKAH